MHYATDSSVFDDFLALPCIRNIIILDNSGARIIAKYYSSEKDPKAFEKELWTKTRNRNATDTDLIVLEGESSGLVTVYKTVGDTWFFVTGSALENELILDSILNAVVSSLFSLLETVTKNILLEYLDITLMVIDEIIDNGIVLEADPEVVSQRILLAMKREPKFDTKSIEQKTKKLRDFLATF